MGNANKRGNFEQRKAQAIIKNAAVAEEKAIKLAEYRKEQLRIKEELEATMSIEDLEEQKAKRQEIMETYYMITSMFKGQGLY